MEGTSYFEASYGYKCMGISDYYFYYSKAESSTFFNTPVEQKLNKFFYYTNNLPDLLKNIIF